MPRPRSLRAIACALCLSAALGLAVGCGSSPKPDPHVAYARSLETFCVAFKGATDQLRAGVAAAPGGRRVAAARTVAAIAGAVETFAGRVGAAIGAFRRVPVPADDRRFHDAAVRGVSDVVRVFHRAAAGARAGKRQPLLQLQGDVGGARLPAVPAALAARAPTCRAISGN